MKINWNAVGFWAWGIANVVWLVLCAVACVIAFQVFDGCLNTGIRRMHHY